MSDITDDERDLARKLAALEGDDPDRRIPVYGPGDKLVGYIPAWSLYVEAAQGRPGPGHWGIPS